MVTFKIPVLRRMKNWTFWYIERLCVIICRSHTLSKWSDFLAHLIFGPNWSSFVCAIVADWYRC